MVDVVEEIVTPVKASQATAAVSAAAKDSSTIISTSSSTPEAPSDLFYVQDVYFSDSQLQTDLQEIEAEVWENERKVWCPPAGVYGRIMFVRATGFWRVVPNCACP